MLVFGVTDCCEERSCGRALCLNGSLLLPVAASSVDLPAAAAAGQPSLVLLGGATSPGLLAADCSERVSSW